jgi:hypothetical protein
LELNEANNPTESDIRIRQWAYEESTPSLVLAAQCLFIIALIGHLLPCCLWKFDSQTLRDPSQPTTEVYSVGRPISIKKTESLIMVVVALFCTIGMICATTYFKRAPAPTFRMKQFWGSWGYAAICAYIGTGVVWTTTVLSIAVYAWEWMRYKRRRHRDRMTLHELCAVEDV